MFYRSENSRCLSIPRQISLRDAPGRDAPRPRGALWISHPQRPQAQAICHPHDPNFQILPRGALRRVFQGIRTSFTRSAAKSFNLTARSPGVNPRFYDFVEGTASAKLPPANHLHRTSDRKYHTSSSAHHRFSRAVQLRHQSRVRQAPSRFPPGRSANTRDGQPVPYGRRKKAPGPGGTFRGPRRGVSDGDRTRDLRNHNPAL